MTALIIILSVLLLLIIADFVISFIMVKINFSSQRHPDYSMNPELIKDDKWKEYLTKSAEGMKYMTERKYEEVYIKSYDGLKLHAYFFPSDLPSKNSVVCIHGFQSMGGQDHGKHIPFLHEKGYNVLIPDDRGHGKSEGNFVGFGYKDRHDVISWCRFLEEKIGSDCKTVIFGISMGGASVVSASGDKNLPISVCGVVDDCGYSSGWDENLYQVKHFYHLPAFPLLYTADLWFRLLGGYSLRHDNPKDLIKNTKIPVLFIHGLDDDFVPTDMSRELFDLAECDKRLLLIPGARHAQSSIVDPATYYKAFDEFTDKCFNNENIQIK